MMTIQLPKGVTAKHVSVVNTDNVGTIRIQRRTVNKKNGMRKMFSFESSLSKTPQETLTYELRDNDLLAIRKIQKT